jgi:hypothetical protein
MLVCEHAEASAAAAASFKSASRMFSEPPSAPPASGRSKLLLGKWLITDRYALNPLRSASVGASGGSSTEGRAQADQRTLADFSFPICGR